MENNLIFEIKRGRLWWLDKVSGRMECDLRYLANAFDKKYDGVIVGIETIWDNDCVRFYVPDRVFEEYPKLEIPNTSRIIKEIPLFLNLSTGVRTIVNKVPRQINILGFTFNYNKTYHNPTKYIYYTIEPEYALNVDNKLGDTEDMCNFVKLLNDKLKVVYKIYENHIEVLKEVKNKFDAMSNRKYNITITEG